MKESDRVWLCRDRRLVLGDRTFVMGILNTTPDSFSDGGRYFDHARAVDHALEMVAEGADIIDIGGESTRPGAEPVPVEEEIRRTAKVVAAIASQSDVLISIDTMKAATARVALAAGAHIVNDVSAGRFDEQMPAVVRESRAGIVLMHMLGMPRTMQKKPVYADVVADVGGYLLRRMDSFLLEGCAAGQVVFDPGIGFGKTLEHNLDLLRNIKTLAALGRPVLVGASRKSFIGKLLGLEADERVSASLGVAAYCILAGANIIRVHDVKDSCHVARVVDMLRQQHS
jgi:dihydropteroate synthase